MNYVVQILNRLSRWALSLDYGTLLDSTEHGDGNGHCNGGMNGDCTWTPSKVLLVQFESLGSASVFSS